MLQSSAVLDTLSRVPLDDPFGLTQSAPMVQRSTVTPIAGPLGEAHADQVAHRLYQAAIGVTVETVTASLAGTSVTRQERPPDVKAALAVLTTLRPSQWRDDRPIAAVQFVMQLPPISTDGQAWLRDIGRGAVIDGTPRPALTVQAEPGQVCPVVAGSVPDPLAVPPSHAPARKSSAKKIKK